MTNETLSVSQRLSATFYLVEFLIANELKRNSKLFNICVTWRRSKVLREGSVTEVFVLLIVVVTFAVSKTNSALKLRKFY
jgi:hypothetical protein